MSTCECCGATEGVEAESSRTMYCRPQLTAWDRLKLEEEGLGEPPDPNADLMLCRGCAAEHHANWDAQWSEYYAGLL